MQKNYFKTIIIAIAILTGFSVTMMAQTQTTIAKMGSTINWPKVKVDWTGDGYIKVNSVPFTKGELKEIITTERGSMTGIPINFRGIEVYAIGDVELTHLYMSECSLGYIDVSKCKDLLELDISKNNLTSLDVSACINLTKLDCSSNQLSELNITGTKLGSGLNATSQSVTISKQGDKYVNTINYTPRSSETTDWIWINDYPYKKGENLPFPTYDNTMAFTIKSSITTTPFSGTIILKDFVSPPAVAIATMTTAAPTVNIQASWVGFGKMTANDTELQSGVDKVITVSGGVVTLKMIGEADFTSLRSERNGLTSLDVSGCSALSILWCNNNNLTSVNISGTAMTDFRANNQSVSVTKNLNGIYNNPISYISKSGAEYIYINSQPYSTTNPLPLPATGNTLTFTTNRTVSIDNNAVFSGTITLEGYIPPIPVTGVSVSPSELTLEIAGTSSLSATVVPETATNKDVTWLSSNTAIATVSASGVVTAIAAGTAIITVSSAENSSIYASCAVTVTPAAPVVIPVTGITVSPDKLSLDVGKTGNLFVSITPATATNKSVAWKSSNEAIATVNASGMVTAIAEGTSVIAVTTVDGGHIALCNVTVNSPVDNGIIAGNTFAAYPNPTDGELTIEGVAPGGIVKLYSATGSLIASYTAHEGVLKIDVSSLKQGLYILNYDGKNMKVIRK